MARIAIEGKYNAALDGLGLVFKGSPERPAYTQKNASVFINRFALGDRSEVDFSFFWFWSESDWTQGFQQEFYTQKSFYGTGQFSTSKVQGFFKNGNNIDTLKEPGKLQSLAEPQLVTGTITAGTLASIGDTTTFGTLFVLGVTRSTGTAQLVNLDPSDNYGAFTVPGGAGPTVNQLDAFGQYCYIAFGAAAAGSAIMRVDQSGVFSVPISGSATIGKGVAVVGSTFYAALTSPTAGTGDMIQYTTDNLTFSTAVSFTGAGRSIVPGSLLDFKSNLYYLLTEGSKVELRQYAYNVDNRVYNWSNLANPKISTFLSWLIVSGTVNQRVMNFMFDGASMSTGFEQLPFTQNIGAGKFYDVGGRAYAPGMLISSDENGNYVFFPGYNFLTNGTQLQPVGAANGNVYFANALNSAGSLPIYKVNPTLGSNYVTTASASSLTSSIHTGFIPGTDKIHYDCTLRMDALNTGEKIIVEYSTDTIATDASATWTTLGSADYAIDGAITSKQLLFPQDTPVISKQAKFRLTLVNSATTSPKLADLIIRYLPVTYAPLQWDFVVEASDGIILINRDNDRTTGRLIRAQLQTSMWSNKIVDYQDVDYFETQLTAAMTTTATIAMVGDTSNAPEAGRFVVDNEQMFYGSKAPTYFDQVTRGARSTQAQSHASAAVAHNGFKVLITDVRHQLPMLNQDKKLEYASTISIRENI